MVQIKKPVNKQLPPKKIKTATKECNWFDYLIPNWMVKEQVGMTSFKIKITRYMKIGVEQNDKYLQR